ncbi:AMP-binding enzyme family protein [Mycobacterium xenopi 4042]|uniref:AMP-binding enzyme family protein n=1 Tax=Mycobacterium xenopi 4042 TaxID=1299334 RepID=X8CM01_MYCXE|nr:AMP-binding enzyme family protein [Mycobacterium xenopi 4042]
MQSYDVGPTTPPILEETIGANFERTVASNPDAEALVDVAANRRWTYGQLNSAIDLIARALISLGIAKGERVAIWAPNCAQWTIVQYATAKIGAILVNINPAYRTHELAYALNQSGVRTLIGLTNFKTSNYRSMICEVSPGCPSSKTLSSLTTTTGTPCATAGYPSRTGS